MGSQLFEQGRRVWYRGEEWRIEAWDGAKHVTISRGEERITTRTGNVEFVRAYGECLL